MDIQQFDFCVVILRGEPLHKAHIKIINHALVIGKRVIAIFGSHRGAPSIKNPWTFEQRKEMTLPCIDEEDRQRIHFTAVRDHPYNDQIWLAEIHAKVRTITDLAMPRVQGWSDYDGGKKDALKIALVGYKKDASSFYLNLFKQWTFVDTGTFSRGVSATDIRKSFFLEDIVEDFKIEDREEDEGEAAPDKQSKTYKDVKEHCRKYRWRDHVPPSVVQYMEDFKKTELFKGLQTDFKYVVNYRSKWEDTPFPVTFTTVDTVIVKSGHVLVIRRKRDPGKNLIAIPGGFIGPTEWIADAAIRELYEETSIEMHPEELKKHLTDQRVFDHPGRSQRGRVITHAYYYELPSKGELPAVKGGDDASEAFWMPLGDLGFLEESMFEDHLHIIQYFTSRRSNQ